MTPCLRVCLNARVVICMDTKSEFMLGFATFFLASIHERHEFKSHAAAAAPSPIAHASKITGSGRLGI